VLACWSDQVALATTEAMAHEAFTAAESIVARLGASRD